MSRSSRDTGHSCVLRSRDRRISTRSCPSGCPCRLASSPKSWRRPLSPWETRCAHSQLPRRLAHTRTVSQAVVCTQGPGAQAPQPAGPSGQLGKEQTRANAEDLFSRHGVRFGQPNSTPHPGTCSVSAELLQDLIRQDGGSTENSFRGSWGIWLQLRWQFRSVCSIWDRFSTGSMAESRGGRGNAALTGFRLHRPAARPSGRGQIPHSFGQECPWAGIQACCGIHRCLDHRLGSHVQRARSIRVWTGPQLHWHINCLELLAVRLALSRLRGRLQRKDVLVRTDNTATVAYINRKAVCAPVACRNSPATSSSGVRSIWGPFVPSTSQECSIGQPTSCLEQHFQASGDSIPRRFSWFGDGSELLRSTCLHLQKPPTAKEFYSLTEATLGTDALAHSWPRGLRKYAFPPSEPTSTDTVQDQGGRGAGLVSGSILAQQDLVPGTHAPRDSPSLANSSEEGSAFSETGHPMAPAPGPVENSTYGPWMGRGGSSWPTPGGSTHYHFSTGTVHETGLYSEVEPVRRMVFLPPGGPPEMLDQSCAFLLTARVGA